MEYPVVYEKTAKTFNHLGLGVLDSAYDVMIHEVINGEYTLQFSMRRDDPKWALIGYDNLVKVNGQLFRIRGYEDGRGQDGKLSALVKCNHVWYEANDCKYIPHCYSRYGDSETQVDGWIGEEAREILARAFDGTPFSVGTVTVNKETDIFATKTNPAAIVTQMIDNIGGELQRDNYTVNYLTQIGGNYGVILRTGKNLKNIKRVMDDSEVITRLYPYGKDDLDITTVTSGGKAYIDSPLIGSYSYIKEGYREYPDFDSEQDENAPQKLMERAAEEWSTAEKDGIDKPKVSYTVQATSLKNVSLGDRVRVIDEDLGIDISSRVVEMEYYPYEPHRGTVKLSNHIHATANLMDKLIAGSAKVNKTTTPDGIVKSKYIDGVRCKLKNDFNQSTKPFVVHDFGDMWVNDKNNPTAALAIVDGMFALANSKTGDNWDWRIIGGKDGQLVADTLSADWVSAGQIRADKINTSNISIVRENNDNSKTVIDADGVKVIHSPNDYTILNKYGVRRYVDGQLVPLTWLTAFRTCSPAINDKWEYYNPQYILLEGKAWQLIAQNYVNSSEAQRQRMFQAQIVRGVPNLSMSGVASIGWKGDILSFSTDTASGVILAPTNDNGTTEVKRYFKGTARDETVYGIGAIMLIGGGGWTRYVQNNIWTGQTGTADITVFCTGTPDYI